MKIIISPIRSTTSFAAQKLFSNLFSFPIDKIKRGNFFYHQKISTGNCLLMSLFENSSDFNLCRGTKLKNHVLHAIMTELRKSTMVIHNSQISQCSTKSVINLLCFIFCFILRRKVAKVSPQQPENASALYF